MNCTRNCQTVGECDLSCKQTTSNNETNNNTVVVANTNSDNSNEPSSAIQLHTQTHRME